MYTHTRTQSKFAQRRASKILVSFSLVIFNDFDDDDGGPPLKFNNNILINFRLREYTE